MSRRQQDRASERIIINRDVAPTATAAVASIAAYYILSTRCCAAARSCRLHFSFKPSSFLTPPPFKFETQVNSCISPLQWDDEFPSHFYSLLYNKKIQFNLGLLPSSNITGTHTGWGHKKLSPFEVRAFAIPSSGFPLMISSVSRARARVSYQCENSARLGANLANCQSAVLFSF